MKLLITGASGRVGGGLAAALKGQVDMRLTGRGPGAVALDFLDPATFEPALDGRVFRMTSQGHPFCERTRTNETWGAVKTVGAKMKNITIAGLVAATEAIFVQKLREMFGVS